MLAETFGLNAQDMVVDLGCGTGQLTLPIAHRVRAVIGMDPEPDMLRRARHCRWIGCPPQISGLRSPSSFAEPWAHRSGSPNPSMSRS
jgi:trans-aconitate methyltransferase